MRKPIDDIIDKPMNELTEDELELIIEWKAQLKFQDMQAEAQRQQLQNEIDTRIAIEQEKAQSAIDQLAEYKAYALNFYESTE